MNKGRNKRNEENEEYKGNEYTPPAISPDLIFIDLIHTQVLFDTKPISVKRPTQ